MTNRSSKRAAKPAANRSAKAVAKPQPKPAPRPRAHNPSATAAFGPAGVAGETLPEGALAPDAALHEAEGEIGINQWLDPETGEPAEGQSPPHLEEE